MFLTKRVGAAVLLLLAAALLTTGTAQAHSDLESASPASGEVLKSSAEEVTLIFNETIRTKGSGIIVTDADGRRFDEGDAVVVGATAKQSIKKLTAPGRYTVRYRVVSADGHVVSSKYSFAFAPPSPGAPSSTPVASTTNQTSTGNSAVVVGAIAGAIAGGLTGVYLIRRKRSQRAA